MSMYMCEFVSCSYANIRNVPVFDLLISAYVENVLCGYLEHVVRAGFRLWCRQSLVCDMCLLQRAFRAELQNPRGVGP